MLGMRILGYAEFPERVLEVRLPALDAWKCSLKMGELRWSFWAILTCRGLRIDFRFLAVPDMAIEVSNKMCRLWSKLTLPLDFCKALSKSCRNIRRIAIDGWSKRSLPGKNFQSAWCTSSS